MRQKNNHLRLFFFLLVFLISWVATCHGRPAPGQPAPWFALNDTEDTEHDLSRMADKNLIILYFFDAESRPSQEGLLNLDQLLKQYKEADLTVLGVTLSPPDKTAAFLSATGLGFPVLPDTKGVSDLYGARLILPTVCIIGPELKVLDYIQGGGKTVNVMLLKVAERQLQRRQSKLAKAIGAQVANKEPGNVKARTVQARASLQEGDTDSAEKIFLDLAKQKGEAEIAGKEGLADLYAKNNNTQKALELVQEIEEKVPERAYPHAIKGKILYAQNKKKEAAVEFKKATEKKEVEPFQKAVAYNHYGRLYATEGKFEKSRELYKEAISLDPFYVEATSNIGMTYEREGEWEKALETYRKALEINKNDTFAAVLASKAAEMLAMQKDIAAKKRIDSLVKELAERYKSQETSWFHKEDTWTSRPMVMTFVDMQEKGGLSERDGFSTVLTAELGSTLNSSGRVRVVERALLERLLEELNLGSSELADPDTALRLGKVLAAKIIGTGSLYYLPDGTLLSLRLVDTETSAISKVITRQMKMQAELPKELHALNRDILKTVIEQYPLQGYIIQAEAGEVLINIGAEQGVVLGTRFDVIEEGKPIKYKGKKLQSEPQQVARVEVIRVEPGLSYGRVLQQSRPLKKNDMIKEIIEPTATL